MADSGKKVRVAVIGGGFGRVHIFAYRACDNVEVTAFCQRTREAAERIGREFGIPHLYADYRELLEAGEIDALSIAAPAYLHYPVTIEALGRGIHVLCEKPLAINGNEAAAMLARAQDAKLIHMTAFNYRFIPAILRLKELIDESYLGRIFHVSAVWFAERRADLDAPLGWRYRRELAGVGALGDVGVHLIDLLRWLIGPFKKISAHSAIFTKERPLPDGSGKGAVTVEDSCAFLAELEGGVQASLHVSGVARHGNYQAIEVFGSNGMLRVVIDRKQPDWIVGKLWGAHGNKASGPEPLPIPEAWTRGFSFTDRDRSLGEFIFSNLTRRFVRGIRTGEQPEPSFRDGLEAQKVLDAVLKSAARESWVQVD